MSAKNVFLFFTFLAAVGGAVFAFSRKVKALSTDEIAFSNLVAEPDTVLTGEPVNITVTITNLSGDAGKYTVIVGGDVMAQIIVNLGPGESQNVSFTFVPQDAKTYVASVDGLTVAFTAVEPPVANIVLSDLRASPENPYVGEEVTITVTATNIGNAAGSRTIELMVN